MNILLRVIAALFGLVLLLPGLCTLIFGGAFTFGGAGGAVFGVPMMVVGGLIVWGGVMTLIWVFRRD